MEVTGKSSRTVGGVGGRIEQGEIYGEKGAAHIPCINVVV